MEGIHNLLMELQANLQTDMEEITQAEIEQAEALPSLNAYDMSRIIPVHSLEDGASHHIIERLLFHTLRETTQPITLWFNSDGGNVEEALTIIDAMQMLKSTYGLKINGMVMGNCFSSAVAVLQICDRRVMSKRSLMMVHGFEMDYRGVDFTQLNEHLLRCNVFRTWFVDIFSERSNKSREEWADILDNKNSTYLSAEQALEWGLIDEVL